MWVAASVGLESWMERKTGQEKVSWALAFSPLCFLTAEEMHRATYSPAATRPLLGGSHPCVDCILAPWVINPYFLTLLLSDIGHSNRKSDKYSYHAARSTILSKLVLVDFCLPLVFIPFSPWTFLGSLIGCGFFPARTCDLPKSSWIAPPFQEISDVTTCSWFDMCPWKALEACCWAHAPGSTSRRPYKFLLKEMAL